MSATLRVQTLGCKVNQYETEFVRQALVDVGYRDAEDDRAADLCVVNTCTVTAEGDAKSRKAIRRLARENPDARIVVMGCYASRAPEEAASLPGVAEVVTDKRELPDLLGRFGVVDVPHGISRFPGRHRAYVKVQDGCLLRCSFCIIPQVRPHFFSRPIDHVVEEAARLVDSGRRELVLTGVHLGHYGVEFSAGRPSEDWVRLPQLLRRLAEAPGEFRLRLSSIETTEVSAALLDVMAEFDKKVCPHLHVCLQSGSDAVLRRMRRRWGARRIIDRCRLAKEKLERPALTTDVIVGFPGETEADFQATCRAVREIGFSKVHVFPFSPRKGTDAATLPNQVPAEVKQDRVARLLELEAELRADYAASLVGREVEVMVEEATDGQARGATCRYLAAELPALHAAAGELVRARVVSGGGDGLQCVAVATAD